jgi:hypothetical protein
LIVFFNKFEPQTKGVAVFTLDRLILSGFEKLSYGFHKLTGGDNFLLAWICWWGMIACGFGFACYVALLADFSSSAYSAFWHACGFSTFGHIIVREKRRMKSHGQTLARSSAEIFFPQVVMRLALVGICIGAAKVMIPLPPVLAPFRLVWVEAILATCILYFVLATPLPPCRSLLSKWVQAIRSFFSPAMTAS